MDLAQARRFARHIALPEIGPEGQRRILDARVLFIDAPAAGLALESAALYLAAAGVSAFDVIAAPGAGPDQPPAWAAPFGRMIRLQPRPTAGSAWAAALQGVTVALRADFGDDSFVDACRECAVRAVIVRTKDADDGMQVDALSLQPPAATDAHVASVPPSVLLPSSLPSPLEASAQVLAGTLAAAEALWLICGRPDAAPGRMQHMSFPLGIPKSRPTTYTIPWPSRA